MEDLTPLNLSPRKILSRQRNALKQVIEEVTENENNRLLHLQKLRKQFSSTLPSSVSSSAHSLLPPIDNNEIGSKIDNQTTSSFINKNELVDQKLNEIDEKFNVERQIEQERIIRLFHDYSSLKQALFHNEVNLKEKSNQINQKTKDSIQRALTASASSQIKTYPNRFSGMQTDEENQFYKSMWNKFEKDYAKHKHMNNKLPKFDPIEERHQLQLLRQKKEILGKMIELQNKELCELSASTIQASTSYNVKNKHPQSSTGESWATFGPGIGNTAPVKKRPSFVPKLKLTS